jgi:CheY-like chemotaxis protein
MKETGMNKNGKPITILVADDDPDDRMMIKEALEEARLANAIDFVEDGVELMDYLRRRGKHAERPGSAKPDLLLLDLNMPRKDGREALEEIRADSDLRRIPVIVLTTSAAEEDIARTYDLGASSFITKPVSFDDLVRTMKTMTDYWLQIVSLPQH